jgi:hypothetical protein
MVTPIWFVPQRLHDHPQRDPLCQQQRRAAVPQVVEALPPQPGPRHERVELLHHGAGLQRGADRRGEDEVGDRLAPAHPCPLPLRPLPLPMHDEQCEQGGRERQRPPTLRRLQIAAPELPVDALQL